MGAEGTIPGPFVYRGAVDPREDLRRYLASRLAECEARPELAAHSIAAYRRAIATVEAGGDVGDLFHLAKADSLDRYRNLERLHASLGDERKAAANRLR